VTIKGTRVQGGKEILDPVVQESELTLEFTKTLKNTYLSENGMLEDYPISHRTPLTGL